MFRLRDRIELKINAVRLRKSPELRHLDFALIKTKETYYIKPFSLIYYKNMTLVLTDQKYSKFKVQIYLENNIVTGHLVSSGPPTKYMCIDNIICDEDIKDISINLEDLIY